MFKIYYSKGSEERKDRIFHFYAYKMKNKGWGGFYSNAYFGVGS